MISAVAGRNCTAVRAGLTRWQIAIHARPNLASTCRRSSAGQRISDQTALATAKIRAAWCRVRKDADMWGTTATAGSHYVEHVEHSTDVVCTSEQHSLTQSELATARSRRRPLVKLVLQLEKRRVHRRDECCVRWASIVRQLVSRSHAYRRTRAGTPPAASELRICLDPRQQATLLHTHTHTHTHTVNGVAIDRRMDAGCQPTRPRAAI